MVCVQAAWSTSASGTKRAYLQAMSAMSEKQMLTEPFLCRRFMFSFA